MKLDKNKLRMDCRVVVSQCATSQQWLNNLSWVSVTHTSWFISIWWFSACYTWRRTKLQHIFDQADNNNIISQQGKQRKILWLILWNGTRYPLDGVYIAQQTPIISWKKNLFVRSTCSKQRAGSACRVCYV